MDAPCMVRDVITPAWQTSPAEHPATDRADGHPLGAPRRVADGWRRRFAGLRIAFEHRAGAAWICRRGRWTRARRRDETTSDRVAPRRVGLHSPEVADVSLDALTRHRSVVLVVEDDPPLRE